MTIFVTKTRSKYNDEDDEFNPNTRLDVICDDDAEFTGLYDQHGNKLYRIIEKQPIGFDVGQ